jgi:hypothetical protein
MLVSHTLTKGKEMPENNLPPPEAPLHQSVKNHSLVLPQWLITFSQPSRMLRLAPFLGFLLTAPSFFTGYFADDHFYRQHSIDKTIFNQRPVWDYFNFVSTDAETARFRERGILPWWTPDAFRLHFFRPITSVVHAFLFNSFGEAPWILHIGLALLYALLIFLCAKLLTRFSSNPVALGIGTLLFAIDDSHAYSAGWISAYNTMLGCIVGLSAILLYDRWRRIKSALGLALFVLAFFVALLCSEGAMGLMGYVVAYAIFIERGAWYKKLAVLVPGISIAVGYALFYSLRHLGVKASGAFLSPTDDLWGSVLGVLSNTIMLVPSQLLSFPPLAMMLQMAGPKGLVVAGVLLCVIIFIFRHFFFSNRIVAFFGVGMVLSVVPYALGGAQDRYLIWAGLGACGLLGELFALPVATLGTLQRISARILLFSNTVISLVFFIPFLLFYSMFELSAPAFEKNVSTRNTVVLNGPLEVYFMYPPARRCANGDEWPQHFYYLYAGFDTVTIKRTGERALLAEISHGMFAKQGERLSRSKQFPFKQGDSVNLQLMTVVIEKVTPDGRPLKVSFMFKNDLTNFVWLRWTKKGPMKCAAPVMGEELRLFAPLM